MARWVSISREGLKIRGPISSYFIGEESEPLEPPPAAAAATASERRKGAEQTVEMGHKDFHSSEKSILVSVLLFFY